MSGLDDGIMGYNVGDVMKNGCEIVPENAPAYASSVDGRCKPACRSQPAQPSQCNAHMQGTFRVPLPCDQVRMKQSRVGGVCPNRHNNGQVQRPIPAGKSGIGEFWSKMRTNVANMQWRSPVGLLLRKPTSTQVPQSTSAKPICGSVAQNAPCMAYRGIEPASFSFDRPSDIVSNNAPVAQGMACPMGSNGRNMLPDPTDRLCAADVPRVYSEKNCRALAPATGPTELTRHSSYGQVLYGNRNDAALYAFPDVQEMFPKGAGHAYQSQLQNSENSFEDGHFEFINTSHDDSMIKSPSGYYDACCHACV
jgi:hypothetical protein